MDEKNISISGRNGVGDERTSGAATGTGADASSHRV